MFARAVSTAAARHRIGKVQTSARRGTRGQQLLRRPGRLRAAELTHGNVDKVGRLCCAVHFANYRLQLQCHTTCVHACACMPGFRRTTRNPTTLPALERREHLGFMCTYRTPGFRVAMAHASVRWCIVSQTVSCKGPRWAAGHRCRCRSMSNCLQHRHKQARPWAGQVLASFFESGPTGAAFCTCAGPRRRLIRSCHGPSMRWKPPAARSTAWASRTACSPTQQHTVIMIQHAMHTPTSPHVACGM